jgi:hypothetical protein
MRATSGAFLILGLAAWLGGCAPETGSPRWCETMRDKPSGDWSANEAVEFARSCLLGEE